MARARTEVAVGDTLEATTVPVTRGLLVAYAAASLDQNPIHQDESFAKEVGLPDVIAHGMWTMGATGSVLADWVGDPGRILSFATRFPKMVVVPREGTEIVVSGVVKKVDPDAGTATVEMTTTCRDEKVLGRCLAVVALD